MRMNDWKYIGAWTGGTVSSVALSPSSVIKPIALAATSAGLFRSTDGGAQWKRATTGFADPGALAVAFAPEQGDIAWAASEQGRLYRSADGGAVWEEISNWAGLGLVTAIAFSPVYVTDRTVFVATPHGIFRTLDDGAEWQEASFGLLDLDVLCLVCAPDFGTSGVVWAGTALGGFFRSRNEGRAWRESGGGLPDCAIQSVALSPYFAHDQTMYVGTESDGVYISRNGGISWQTDGSWLRGHSVNSLAVVAVDSQIALLAGTDAGVYRTDDGGVSWALTEQGEFLALDLAARIDGMVLAATYQEALALSHDSGRTWQQNGQSIAAHAPPLTVRVPNEKLYAVDSDGILAESSDGGAQWHAVASDVLAMPAIAVSAFMSPTEQGETLALALADGQVMLLHEAGTYRTIGEPVDGLVALAATATDEGSVLSGCSQSGQAYLCKVNEGAWTQLASPWAGDSVLSLNFSPWYSEDQTLTAVTARGNIQNNYDVRVWQSSNNGAAWEELAALESEVPAVLTLAVPDPIQRGFLLATQHRVIRLYQADDELAVDQHFFETGTRVTALVAAPKSSADSTLYAATSRGIYVSTDGGQQWQAYSSLPAERPIVALIPEAREKGVVQILAVLLGGEIWQTTHRL